MAPKISELPTTRKYTGRQFIIHATKYCVWRGVDFSKKIFPPKNLYILFLAGKYTLLPLPLSSSPFLSLDFLTSLPGVSAVSPNSFLTSLPGVSAACGSWNLALLGRRLIYYLLIFELSGEVLAGGRSRTAKPWIAGLSSYPLDHEGLVGRIILELPDML